MLGQILTALGLITAIGGPVLASLLANPLVAAHANLAGYLAIVGVIVTVAGVAHDALLKWQAANQAYEIKLAALRRP